MLCSGLRGDCKRVIQEVDIQPHHISSNCITKVCIDTERTTSEDGVGLDYTHWLETIYLIWQTFVIMNAETFLIEFIEKGTGRYITKVIYSSRR